MSSPARPVTGAARSREPARHRIQPVSLGALLDHAPFGVLLSDLDGCLLAWNGRAEAMLRLAASSVGRHVTELFAEPVPLLRAFGLARAGRLTEPYAGHTLDPAGAAVEVTAVPTRRDDGATAVLILLQDVSPRRLAERSRDRLAAQVALLAEISEAFAGTLDGEEALRRLATQVVPTLGDWVTLETCDPRGAPHRVTVHHRDPGLADLVRAADETLPVPLSERAGDRRRPDGSVLLADVDDVTLAALFPAPGHRELVRRLGAVSLVVVPLPGRDRQLGSMTLLNGPTSPAFTEQDVAVAGEGARRAGVALETMGLYAEQRDLAEGLQRSLLSDPVQPRNGQIVVRYVAAAQEAQVGGDWYDAFVQPDGSTVLVIGDVVGHDTRAAAAMGQLRGLLRGIGYASGAGPADMLCRLDAAIDGLRISTTATAVVAVLRDEAETPGRGSTRLRWSNAGHPPPLLLAPGQPPRLLDGQAANLLLGVVADAHRDEHEVDLDDGAVLLLYTDGLVERRGQDLDDGLDELLTVVGELSDLPPAELCNELLRRLVPEGHDDDVALAGIRSHRPPRA